MTLQTELQLSIHFPGVFLLPNFSPSTRTYHQSGNQNIDRSKTIKCSIENMS